MTAVQQELPDTPDGSPDPEGMTPRERQVEINSIRQRVIAGEDVPQDTLRYGLRLIRAERQDRTGRKPAARSKKPKRVSDLSDF